MIVGQSFPDSSWPPLIVTLMAAYLVGSIPVAYLIVRLVVPGEVALLGTTAKPIPSHW